jgi:hypothetical protein
MPARGTVEIDVTVDISATLKTSATRAPELVGSFTKRIAFKGSADAILQVSLEGTNFRVDDHAPRVTVKIAAAAYPGLLPASIPVDLG